MVKLNYDYVIKRVLNVICVTEKEKIDALKKINHLCLSNKLIHKIENLSHLTRLTDLYLHENRISKIENLNHNLNLTHLYLQHNAIEKIENINHLTKLKKLYLGHNKITLVESLDNLESLEELHIESQNLPPGESLYFDPRTVQVLSKTLRILDISNNQLLTLGDLRELQAVEEVDASNNNISNLTETCKIITCWGELTTLVLEGNPVAKIGKYVEKVTTFTQKLSNLDGKMIKDTNRNFLQHFENAKIERRKAEEKRSSHYRFSADIESLAEHLPPGIRNSVSRSILRETVPSITNLTFSLQQPAIKELPLEKRVLVRSIKKSYNSRRNATRSQIQDEKELHLC